MSTITSELYDPAPARFTRGFLGTGIGFLKVFFRLDVPAAGLLAIALCRSSRST
jgi:hypothetical protein